MLSRNMSKHVMFRLAVVSAILISQSAVTAMPRYDWTNNPAEDKLKEMQNKTFAENIMEEISERNTPEPDKDSNEFKEIEPSTSVIEADKPSLKVTEESTMPSNEPVISHGHEEVTDRIEDTAFVGNILNTGNDPNLAILTGALDTFTDNPIFSEPTETIPFKQMQMDPIVSITAVPIIAISYLQPIIFIKHSDLERLREQNFDNLTFLNNILSAIKDVIMILPTLTALPTNTVATPTKTLTSGKLNPALELIPSESVILEETSTTKKVTPTIMPREQLIREYVRRKIKEHRKNRAKKEYKTIFSNNPILLSGRNFATPIKTPEVTTSIEKAILTSTETLIPPAPITETTELTKPTETVTLATSATLSALTERTPIDTTTLTATLPLTTLTNNMVLKTSTETITLTTPTETTSFATPTQTTLITPIEMTTLTIPTESTTLIMPTETVTLTMPAEVTTSSEMTTFSMSTQTTTSDIMMPTTSVETTSIQSTLTIPTEKVRFTALPQTVLTTLTETTTPTEETIATTVTETTTSTTEMTLMPQTEEMEQRKRTKRTRENKQKPKLATVIDLPNLTEATTLPTPTETAAITTLTTPIEAKALTSIEEIKEFAHGKIENSITTKNTDNQEVKPNIDASINKLTLTTPAELTTEVITMQHNQKLREFMHKRIKENLEKETREGNMFRKMDHISSPTPKSLPTLTTTSIQTESTTSATMLTETLTERERDLKIKEFMRRRIKDSRKPRTKLGKMLTFQNISKRQFSSTIIPTFVASAASRIRSRKLATTMEIPRHRTGRMRHDQKENRRHREQRKNKRKTGNTDHHHFQHN